jgi:hypothetical protein
VKAEADHHNILSWWKNYFFSFGFNFFFSFPFQNCLKQGDALSPLLFNFALECAIRKAQENQGAIEIK